MSSESSPGAPPGVSVVIATRSRPELLRGAVRSVLAQEYAGPVEVLAVFDQCEVDSLEDVHLSEQRTLRTLGNTRTPGLAGARNTGIVAAAHELIAFCDDDDEWLPTKLTEQVGVFTSRPESSLVATGIRIQTEGPAYERIPPDETGFDDLLRSRVTGLHPSSYLMRREDLLGQIGLIDEALPGSYGEDYDLLLRAARVGAVISVSTVLVLVNWNRPSFFRDRWQTMADALTYMLDKFPEFATTKSGSARMEGQIAYAYAAAGNRRAAGVWARRAMRHDPKQLRSYAALLVAGRLLSPNLAMRLVNLRGRGL